MKKHTYLRQADGSFDIPVAEKPIVEPSNPELRFDGLKFDHLADRLTRALIGEREYGVKQLSTTLLENDYNIKAYSAQVPTEYNQVFRDLVKDIKAVLQKHLE